jgi:hypothetical protein
MSPSNHQYVGEPSNMLQANMGQLWYVEGIITQKLAWKNCKFDSPRKHKHKKVLVNERVFSAKITSLLLKSIARVGPKN